MTVCTYCKQIGGYHRDGCPRPANPIYCPAQTFAGTRTDPSEWCENEVDDYGTYCPQHDYTEEDRAADDADTARKEARHDCIN